MIFRSAIIISALIFLSGCATNKVINAKYSSEVDPDFPFTTEKTIVVYVSKQGNNLESKHYVNQVVDALKQRGLTNTYSYRDISKLTRPADIAVIINVSKRTSSYQYQGENYGMVDSGQSTVKCSGFGNSINCTENKQQTFGVTGYSTKTGIITSYMFSTNWFDENNDQRIMFSFASTHEEECSDKAIYEFLISQTIRRLNFEEPSEYDYSIQMPENYNCKY